MISDNSELLRRYLAEKSETAFSELVQRNINLVYSAAFRQVNGDEAMAQDVTQAVFTDLVRKAPALVRHSSLTGWLYTSTRYLASKALRADQRRRAREEKAHAMTAVIQDPDYNAGWEEFRPVLDEVIHELNRADREAVLMRFFEGRGLDEIGVHLGVSTNTARMRVDRALDKLRKALARRGISSTSAALGAALAERAVAAAPAGLAARVSHVSFEAGAGLAGLLPTLLSLLAGMKPQLLVGGAVLACLVVGSVSLYYGAHRLFWAKPVEGLEASGTGATASPSTVVGSLTNLLNKTSAVSTPGQSNHLVLKIVDAASGKPVPNVRIESWAWERDKVRGREPLQATRFGVREVPVSRDTVTQLILVTETEGFADTRVQWRVDRGERIPDTYTVRLARSVHLGGQVVDADGQPVAGAKVGFNNQPGPDLEGVGPQTANFAWPFYVTATTDAQGRWTMDRIGEEATRTIYGKASHPEHVESEFAFANRDAEALKQLRAGTHVFRLGRAVLVRGTVVDSDGQPVAEASVLVGQLGESGRREGRTKSDGSFAISGCKPGENLLTADAKGFAPATLDVTLKAESEPFHLTLRPGRLLRLRVVDPKGQPVPKAIVFLNTRDHGPRREGEKKSALAQVSFHQKTDQEGRVKWEEAPDQELSFDAAASGYMRVYDFKAWPDGLEHVITLPLALTISGTVHDAASGQPIPKFRIITGWPEPDRSNNTTNGHWSTIDRFWLNFGGGKFRHVFEEPVVVGTSNPGFIFKFEADGYASLVTRVVGQNEGEATFDVALNPAKSTVVTALLPNGRPAPGADVALVSAGARFELLPGGFSRDNLQIGGSLLLSEKDGSFKLPPDDAITRVAVAHPEGFADVARVELATEPVVRLQSWGRLEGNYLSGGKAVAGRELWFQYSKMGSIHGDFHAYRAVTDENGRFTFPQVPPGKHQLIRLVPLQNATVTGWSHQPLEELEIRPGETTRVTVGGSTYRVTARLSWPQGLDRKPSWTITASLNTALPAPPKELAGDAQALSAWQALPEVKAAMAKMRHFSLEQEAEGVFAVEDVPPGEYTFSAVVVEPPATTRPMPVHARAEAQVTVPSDPPSGTLDLGEVLLRAMP
jgi:RNA polymerase sigma factor (sigma-70 family)